MANAQCACGGNIRSGMHDVTTSAKKAEWLDLPPWEHPPNEPLSIYQRTCASCGRMEVVVFGSEPEPLVRRG